MSIYLLLSFLLSLGILAFFNFLGFSWLAYFIISLWYSSCYWNRRRVLERNVGRLEIIPHKTAFLNIVLA